MPPTRATVRVNDHGEVIGVCVGPGHLGEQSDRTVVRDIPVEWARMIKARGPRYGEDDGVRSFRWLYEEDDQGKVRVLDREEEADNGR